VYASGQRHVLEGIHRLPLTDKSGNSTVKKTIMPDYVTRKIFKEEVSASKQRFTILKGGWPQTIKI